MAYVTADLYARTIAPNEPAITFGWVVGAERRSAPTVTTNVSPKSLGAIVRAYKSAVTYAINALQNQRGAVLWQRNYYEHVIRDEKDYQAKHDYILSNPMNWDEDEENIRS